MVDREEKSVWEITIPLHGPWNLTCTYIYVAVVSGLRDTIMNIDTQAGKARRSQYYYLRAEVCIAACTNDSNTSQIPALARARV